MKKLDILIPTYNQCKKLRKCLSFIPLQDYPKNCMSITVYDDASTDSTPLEIPKYLDEIKTKYGFHAVSFLRTGKNIGVAGARAFLAQHISPDSELILFLDDDVYMESPDTFRDLHQCIENNTTACVAGPRIVRYGKPDKTLLSAFFMNRWSGKFIARDSSNPLECDWIDPLCMLMPVQILKESGGFTPEYYRSHEGIDFCFKVRNHGGKIVYCPSITIQHDSNVTSYPAMQRLYYLYRNKILLIKRHLPFLNRTSALSFQIFFGLPRYIVHSISFHKKIDVQELKLILKAFYDGFSGKTGRLG